MWPRAPPLCPLPLQRHLSQGVWVPAKLGTWDYEDSSPVFPRGAQLVQLQVSHGSEMLGQTGGGMVQHQGWEGLGRLPGGCGGVEGWPGAGQLKKAKRWMGAQAGPPGACTASHRKQGHGLQCPRGTPGLQRGCGGEVVVLPLRRGALSGGGRRFQLRNNGHIQVSGSHTLRPTAQRADASRHFWAQGWLEPGR